VGIAIPWAILMFAQAYNHGIAAPDGKGGTTTRMPEPYFFFWGSAVMGIAGLAAMANQRLGLVMAWGFLLGAMVYKYQAAKTQAATTAANTNPSALAISQTGRVVAALPGS
jgi:hypothetical protein